MKSGVSAHCAQRLERRHVLRRLTPVVTL